MAARFQLLLAILVGCTAVGPARASEPPKASDVARGWLGLLRVGTPAALIDATALPFTYQEAWSAKQCTSTVRTRAALRTWSSCVRKDTILLGELAFISETLEFHDHPTGASANLRAIAARFTEKGEWTAAYFNGDGVTYEFLILVARDQGKARVRVCIIDAYYDKG